MSEEQQTTTGGSPIPPHLVRARPGDVSLGRSLALVRYLREHCAWDARQTPSSLRPYLLEEAHEVADAIRIGDDPELARELGDLLLNVAFQVVLAEERESFDASSVVAGLEEKMRERHPHVYGDDEQAPDWEQLKARQRESGGAGEGADAGPSDPFDGLPVGLEPLSRALRMQDRAAALNFDWPGVAGAVAKLREEIGELDELLGSADRGRGPAEPDREEPGRPSDAVEDELGDLLFSAVNVCRLAGVHPTTALERAAAKFAARFRRLLEFAARDGLEPRQATLPELDRLWEEVKAEGR
jgi:MazG family protein